MHVDALLLPTYEKLYVPYQDALDISTAAEITSGNDQVRSGGARCSATQIDASGVETAR